MAKKTRKRPDLRTISLPDPEDRALWDAHVAAGVNMSKEICTILRGIGKKHWTPDARIKYLETMISGSNRLYSDKITMHVLERDQKLAQLQEQLEVAIDEKKRLNA